MRCQHNDKDILSQLTANMILALSTQLNNLLKKGGLADLMKLKTMTILYGVTFGYNSQLRRNTEVHNNCTPPGSVQVSSTESPSALTPHMYLYMCGIKQENCSPDVLYIQVL